MKNSKILAVNKATTYRWMPAKLVDCLPSRLMLVNLVNFIEPNLTSFFGVAFVLYFLHLLAGKG